jgi:hypothetical protein
MGVETPTQEQRTPVRRRWRLLSVLVIVNLAAVALVATPSQAQVVTCTSTLSDQTIEASVVVPSGSACQLTNVVVVGRMDVQAGADLFLESTRIQGPLAVAANSFVQASDSRVDGMTTLTNSFGLYSTGSRFDRLVDARGGSFVYSDDSTHWGGVRSESGETVIESGVVIGSVWTSGDRLTDVFDTAVFGPVSITAAEYGSVVCHMGAALSVTVRNSSGVIQIGTAGVIANCGFNLLGSLGVYDNIGADIQITGNFIAGNLACTGNNPVPHGSVNLVGGSKTGQCASLSPAPVPAGVTVESTTDTAPRTSHILGQIEQRLAG